MQAPTTTTTYDAIVVGSGISGGWAAKELTEKGLKVLLLERGRNVEHVKDYVNATKGPWEYPHRGGRTRAFPMPTSCWTSLMSCTNLGTVSIRRRGRNQW